MKRDQLKKRKEPVWALLLTQKRSTIVRFWRNLHRKKIKSYLEKDHHIIFLPLVSPTELTVPCGNIPRSGDAQGLVRLPWWHYYNGKPGLRAVEQSFGETFCISWRLMEPREPATLVGFPVMLLTSLCLKNFIIVAFQSQLCIKCLLPSSSDHHPLFILNPYRNISRGSQFYLITCVLCNIEAQPAQHSFFRLFPFSLHFTKKEDRNSP